MGICKIEADKVMMVGENVLLSRLRNIGGDSLNGKCVLKQYGHRNELITDKYIMYVHIHVCLNNNSHENVLFLYLHANWSP